MIIQGQDIFETSSFTCTGCVMDIEISGEMDASLPAQREAASLVSLFVQSSSLIYYWLQIRSKMYYSNDHVTIGSFHGGLTNFL